MSVSSESTLGKAITGTAVLVALIGGLAAFIGPLHTEVEMLRHDISEHHNTFLEIVKGFQTQEKSSSYREGTVDQQIRELNRITEKLDTNLQREMRDVNATTEAKLTSLDTRLQGEIGVVDKVSKEGNRQMLENAERNRQVGQSNREGLSTLFERVRALESRIK